MKEIKSKEEPVAESGFLFSSKDEAQAAAREVAAIKYIKEKVDFHDPLKVLKIYTSLIKERTFTTPLGYEYLSELRYFLIEQPQIKNEDISDIPVNSKIIVKESILPDDNKAVLIRNAKKKINYKKRFINSIAINIALCIVIIAMFIITNTSGNINILNYENKIIDKYEQWEIELTQREEALKKSEEKLK